MGGGLRAMNDGVLGDPRRKSPLRSSYSRPTVAQSECEANLTESMDASN